MVFEKVGHISENHNSEKYLRKYSNILWKVLNSYSRFITCNCFATVAFRGSAEAIWVERDLHAVEYFSMTSR